MIGRIQRVSLREVWPHEAHNFTRWLQENIDLLGEVLGRTFSNAEREQAAGNFSVDIVAEDETGNAVIIENQLERSNHDHLGKLLTYLVAIGAKTAVWIVADPRPEHVSVITWLNESSPADFYLLKVEGIRIGNSPPAPLLTLIVGPSAESREAGETRRDLTERHSIRHRFWTDLLERARQRTRLHANISPAEDSWVATGAGKAGLLYHYSIRRHEGKAVLYIDRGRGAEEENKAIFNALLTRKDAIEQVFGEPLEWISTEGIRACRIGKTIDVGGYRDDSKWPEIQDAMIDAMIRLEAAVRSHLATLPGRRDSSSLGIVSVSLGDQEEQSARDSGAQR